MCGPVHMHARFLLRSPTRDIRVGSRRHVSQANAIRNLMRLKLIDAVCVQRQHVRNHSQACHGFV